MIRPGKVIKSDKGGLLVSFERYEACSRCGGCVAGMKKDTLIRVAGHANPGEYVSVEMPAAQVVKASFLMYMIPLAGFLLGLWVAGKLLNGNDLLMTLGGVIGMLAGMGVLALLDRRLALKKQWQPQVVAVISEEEAKAMNLCDTGA